jgi:hypothetical protein
VLAWADDANDGSVSGNTFATDLKVGRDADNLLDFTTDNQVTMRVNGADEVLLAANALSPAAADGAALGTTSLEWSDLYLADSGVIYLGNDQDVTIAHNADKGITLTTTATGDSDATSGFPVLTIGSQEAEVVSGEFLGAISFAALGESDGTDANLPAAAISAVAEDTFAADNNACGLHFATGKSGAATSKMNLNQDGDLHLSVDTVLLEFGADSDVSLQHVADTGLLLNSSRQLQFGDSATHIKQVSDSNLEIEADGSVIIDSPVLTIEDDGAIVKFGANSEVTLTHNHDKGLILKHTATADDKPVVLTLQTGETDIAADDVLGAIEFQAPDEGTGTDAIAVAAAIKAVSEGDFAADSNATFLGFYTGASEAATLQCKVTSAGHFVPATAGAGDLGTAALPWGNVFTQDLHLNNGRGDWVLIEEPSYLTIRNNANGRRYKLLMEDITDTPGAYGPANDGSM